jgi:hypothetical protein
MSTRDPTRNATVIVSTFKIKKKKRQIGHSKGRAEGNVYSYKCLHEKTETSQINNPMMHLKLLEKQE